MRFRIVLAAHLLGCLFMSSVGFAFGPDGHKIVALIADNHLTSKTRAAVKAILGDETMAGVSSWADQERTRNRKTATWHYIDYEISDGKVLADSDKTGTVLDAITSQSAILANPNADPQDRKRALMYVIHFVGDMHQPLHCADNYDRGGNSVKVVFLGRGGNLHSTWDGAIIQQIMIEMGTSTTVEQVAASLDHDFANLWPDAGKGTVTDWAHESHELAKKYCYSYLKGDTLSSLTVTLGRDYYDLVMPVLRRNMALGGFRLATLLNSMLNNAPKPAAPAPEVTVPQTGKSEMPKD